MLLDQLGDLSILEEISEVVQVPMKFIHVHRNPFDNIATLMLRATESRNAVREEGVTVRRIYCFSLTSYITLLTELFLLLITIAEMINCKDLNGYLLFICISKYKHNKISLSLRC